MTTTPPNMLSIRKAAILVAALDAAIADTLLDALPDDQAAQVRNMVMTLNDVDADERAEVLGEFLGRSNPSSESQPHPEDSTGVELDPDLASRLAESHAAPTSDSGEALPREPRFSFLQQADSASLARLLKSEQPQTVAVVLAYLPRQQAAELLAMFPPPAQTTIVRRLADLDEMDSETLQEVERGLESLVSHHIRRRQRRQEGMQAIAGILAAANPQSQQAILAALGSDSATEQRPTMSPAKMPDRAAAGSAPIRFADLARLTPGDLLTLVRTVDPEFVTLAMAGADASFTSQIFRLLPPQIAQSLQHELNHLGPTRLSDMEDAREELVRAAARLEHEGSIKLPRTRLSMAA